MADKYLNYEGVQRLVEKLKTYISNAVKVTGVKGDAESSYRTGNVNLTAANIGALATSGGFMTGKLYTSFQNAVATGSLSAESTNIPDLCEELRYSNGCCGSCNITTSYTKDGYTIPTSWYNFIWVPHRTGGNNGEANGVNCNYGALYLTSMNNPGYYGYIWIINYNSGIQRLARFTGDQGITLSPEKLTSGYVNIHPENSPILIPFIHNDIAHLLKRGGSAILYHDGVQQLDKDMTPLFDGSGSYFSYNATSMADITEIVIEITCHKVFTYGNWIYIDFGAVVWRSKSVKIEVMNATTTYPNDVWTQKYNTTTNALGHISINTSHMPVGASNTGGGFNKIRLTFSNFNTTQFRISQICVYNYGSLGLRETYMSRGADDPILRNLIPHTNSEYNLGSQNYRWQNVVATNFIDSGGNNLSTQISQRAVSLSVASTANLNNITTPGFYTVGGSSNITNRPPNTDAFGFIVTHNASGSWYTQIAFSANQLPETVWMRTNSSGTWSSWKELIFTDTVTTVTTTGSGNAITSLSASNGAITATKDSTFLTSITSSDVTGALGYTPLTSAQIQAMIDAAIDDIVDGNEVSY